MLIENRPPPFSADGGQPLVPAAPALRALLCRHSGSIFGDDPPLGVVPTPEQGAHDQSAGADGRAWVGLSLRALGTASTLKGAPLDVRLREEAVRTALAVSACLLIGPFVNNGSRRGGGGYK